MPRRQIVENHPHRIEIEKALRNSDKSLQEIGQMYGVSAATLMRYYKRKGITRPNLYPPYSNETSLREIGGQSVTSQGNETHDTGLVSGSEIYPYYNYTGRKPESRNEVEVHANKLFIRDEIRQGTPLEELSKFYSVSITSLQEYLEKDLELKTIYNSVAREKNARTDPNFLLLQESERLQTRPPEGMVIVIPPEEAAARIADREEMHFRAVMTAADEDPLFFLRSNREKERRIAAAKSRC